MLDFIGLCLVTIGALGAIWCAPGPTYYKSGNVGLGPERKKDEDDEAFRRRRIRMHYYQKYGLRLSFALIALGSAFQGYAAWAK